jgi:hypothetical protein
VIDDGTNYYLQVLTSESGPILGEHRRKIGITSSELLRKTSNQPMKANGGIASRLRSAHPLAAVDELGSLGR